MAIQGKTIVQKRCKMRIKSTRLDLELGTGSGCWLALWRMLILS